VTPNSTDQPNDAATKAAADTAALAAKATTVVPDKYDFKAPEGATLDATLIERATPIFKELGLDQAGAQKLIDLQSAIAKEQALDIDKVIKAQGAKWMAKAEADPELAGKLPAIKEDMGRALDGMVAAKVITSDDRAEFQVAMNASMVGNNPAFIKIFKAMGARFVEGKPVPGGNIPSVQGQQSNGRTAPPSMAASMYPNLPH